ncbi:hypothetical protein E4T38_08594 [Aureobasidium subglaciale]|nr:hypothetical protein E4T38_08594 [Aureobasidium subglaciale]KAI5215134.1 hypothetical protein E4T40_08607 [Aureobasidium subglaciale]KAI5218288.1 hypothetical protein E4T41_08461 [Aureobasidium subglaciale]KAI5256000.1 hypothetical protein E4T46_08495 [Aureobasidium subglaciale]
MDATRRLMLAHSTLALVMTSASTCTGVSPLARRFDLVNVGLDVIKKALTLTVPGGQSSGRRCHRLLEICLTALGPISVAQVATSYSDILYGSVRTVAKISDVPGTTHSFIFYANDTQEVNFAFLTSDLTNEQVNYSSPYSTYSVAAPGDASSTYYEYRLD